MDKRSETNLKSVHPDLVKVVRRAFELDPNFVITCGARTVAEQRRLVAIGASQTMDSRHIPSNGTAKAVDVFIRGRWDWPLYAAFAKVMKQAAVEVGVPIEWGGDWKSFKDGPHFQLPKRLYP